MTRHRREIRRGDPQGWLSGALLDNIKVSRRALSGAQDTNAFLRRP